MVVHRRLGALLGASLLTATTVFAAPHSAHNRHPPSSLPAIVSTTWLTENLPSSTTNTNLVLIDLRDAQSYAAGHVPSSISIPFQGTAFWQSNGPDQTLVMPSAEVASETLSKAGITVDTEVVLVPDAAVLPSHMAMATRAAATLRYAGIPIANIAILDGGYPAWSSAKLPVSTAAATTPKTSNFTSKIDASFVVERDYVRAHIGKASEGVVLIDARTAADYRAGHIESAFSLPTVDIWNAGGIWKSAQELQKMFEAAVGTAPVATSKGEVVVYCRTGMLATAWVYALANVLGFEDVKLYDGSMEDWLKHGEAVTGPQV
ncbi:Rhodanese-like domain-containing protein [Cercophora newfieldiana]|uniref:Rhodanese-like domain-containing protein n=1 Tax=Cercophora newfieldiana TaxID=92897 RepID=A0AA39XUT5_9PEZI|nr:Rhodanese-like domain-containing protein [Cercophora newfieldiana]